MRVKIFWDVRPCNLAALVTSLWGYMAARIIVRNYVHGAVSSLRKDHLNYFNFNLFHPFDNNTVYRIHPPYLILSFYSPI